MRKIWHNGIIKDESEAMISVYDAGMMQCTVFEMTRSFKKVHFQLLEHLIRLFDSMKYIGITTEYSLRDLYTACEDLLKINKPEFNEDDEHRLLINVSAGALSIYKDVAGVVNGTNIMITDFPLRWTVQGMGKLYDTGINAITPNQKTIPSYLMENRIKSHCRMHAVRANIECSGYEGDNNWALLTTPDGFVTEGTGANVFIVKNNTIYTPKPINILNGISRRYVINLAKILNYNVVEEYISPFDFITAQEAFFTGTPFCILPITSINGQEIGDGKMGFYTKRLIEKWSLNVGVDIISQIKKWNETDKTLTGSTPYKFSTK